MIGTKPMSSPTSAEGSGDVFASPRQNQGRKKKSNNNGRFAMLPESVYGHEAVTTLSHAEFRVLFLIAGKYRGFNNGALSLSKAEAGELNIPSRTLYRALSELVRRGIIEQTCPASRVPARAAKYALTWLAVDDTKWSDTAKAPAKIFAGWRPQTGPENNSPAW